MLVNSFLSVKQGVVYQLDVALQSLDTQRAGLVFIYDMTDSKYTNFDYELSQKILTMLKVCTLTINSIFKTFSCEIRLQNFDFNANTNKVRILSNKKIPWKRHAYVGHHDRSDDTASRNTVVK